MTIKLATISAAAWAVFTLFSSAAGQSAPAVLGKYLKPDVAVRGQVVRVEPPKEIKEFVKKVEDAAKKDPVWFKAYSKEAKAGVPLPYHEKLGLSKKEYDTYLKLWDARKIVPLKDGNVIVRLEEPADGEWMVRVSGKGTPISLLRYQEADDTVVSPNGVLTRLDDIAADPRSILGEWTGHEWKFEEEDGLGLTKENFAIGKLADNKWGLIVHRLQSISPAGRLLFDRSLVVRFPLAAK